MEQLPCWGGSGRPPFPSPRLLSLAGLSSAAPGSPAEPRRWAAFTPRSHSEAGAPAVPLPSQPPWHRGRLLLRVIADGALRLPQQLRDNGGSLTRTPCPEPAGSTHGGCLPPHPNPCSKQRDGGNQMQGKKHSGDTGTASSCLPHTERKWGHCRRPALRVPLRCLRVSPRAGFQVALPAVPAHGPQAMYGRQAGDAPAFICRPKGPLHHRLPPSHDPV